MLFATWNVNSLRARLPRVLELLSVHQPDVVALQETKCATATFPLADLEAAGYQVVHNSGGQWAGVALLVRGGLTVVETVLGLDGDVVDTEARWCEASVGGVRFISTYVPNGRTLDSPEYPRKLAFLDAAARRLGAIRAAEPDAGLVLAGDVNIAPADVDVFDPAAFAGATHVSAAERAALTGIMRCGKLLDAYRTLHPDEVQYTWWDYRAGSFHKNLGMRIDLVLVGSELGDALRRCGIDRDFRKGAKPSDHAPLLAELDVPLQ